MGGALPGTSSLDSSDAEHERHWLVAPEHSPWSRAHLLAANVPLPFTARDAVSTVDSILRRVLIGQLRPRSRPSPPTRSSKTPLLHRDAVTQRSAYLCSSFVLCSIPCLLETSEDLRLVVYKIGTSMLRSDVKSFKRECDYTRFRPRCVLTFLSVDMLLI